MKRTVLLLASLATALLMASGVAWAVIKDCTAGTRCIGTDQKDTLKGTEQKNRMYGLGEADNLYG